MIPSPVTSYIIHQQQSVSCSAPRSLLPSPHSSSSPSMLTHPSLLWQLSSLRRRTLRKRNCCILFGLNCTATIHTQELDIFNMWYRSTADQLFSGERSSGEDSIINKCGVFFQERPALLLSHVSPSSSAQLSSYICTGIVLSRRWHLHFIPEHYTCHGISTGEEEDSIYYYYYCGDSPLFGPIYANACPKAHLTSK